MSEEIPWWKKERKHKSFITNKETALQVAGGLTKSLPKSSFVNPVRKKYLPYGHWALKKYDETEIMYVESNLGFGFVAIKDVDF